MNKVAPLFSGCLILLAMSAPSFAQNTYICQLHGKAAYTTVKINSTCQLAKINGLTEAKRTVFAPPIAVASEVALPNDNNEINIATAENDPIAQIWYEYEYGSYDRTPILPPPPPRSEVIVKQTENSKNVHVATKPSSSPRKVSPRVMPIAVVYQAPNTPVLSRREVLSQEIEREQIALKIAQTQLAIAQKRHDTANVMKLNLMVRDRLANVQSLQRELQR